MQQYNCDLQLYHHGISGMKWGNHKTHIRNNSTEKATHNGKDFVKKSLKVIGMLLVTDLAYDGAIHKTAGQAGKAFVKANIQAHTTAIARKSITKIAQNPKFNPIDVAFKTIN